MKILPVIDTCRVGGPGKGLVALVRGVRKRAVIPGVAIFRRSGAPESDFYRTLLRNGITPIIVRERSALDVGALRGLRDAIDLHKPDIVQTHGYKANVLLYALRKAGHLAEGVRWVSWIHGWTAENLRVRLYHRLEKWAVPASDHIVCVSSSLARSCEAFGKRVCVIPNSVDESYTREDTIDVAGLRRELGLGARRIIVVIGRLSHEKGQDRILEVAQKLRDRRDDLCFLLVGEGPEEARLKSRIRQEDLGDMVRILPYTHDVRPYYRLACACVLPSRMEGMPNVILESLAMRCPIVSFDVGGAREIVEDGKDGVLVPQGDVAALAHAVIDVLDDAARAQTMSQRGHAKVLSTYTNQRREDLVCGLYHLLLQNAGPVAR